jgi:murein DD-endopeptidase MepM/ murein hydrolase activator NlpD
VDFAAPSGTPVRAVKAGQVAEAGWDGAYGWKLVIKHADGTETWYCHLTSFAVRSGPVAAGEQVGRVGSTGNTTGPHLHLEVRRSETPVDPLQWLRARGVRV